MAEETLLSADEALARVLAKAVRADSRCVPVERALGLVLGETVCAERDSPPFDRAMMDGYAVHGADAGRTVRLVGEVAAGDEDASAKPLEAGTAVRIMTGACVPAGAEAVVPLEDVTLAEESLLPVPSTVTAEQHIARRGCETRAGTAVVREGDIITPLVAGTLAGVGYEAVAVYPPPRLAILATGNELGASGAAGIRDTNTPMLAVLARSMRVPEPECFRVGDTLASLNSALGACESATHVLLTGGVSAGAYDLVPEALAAWGAKPLLHKVRQKPGKPLLVATRTSAEGHDQLIFGLPGNPLAAHLGFQRYVAPALRVYMNKSPEPRRERATLTTALSGDRTRTTFALATLRGGGGEADARWWAEPVRLRGSADLYSAAKANALLRVEPGQTLAAGSEVVADWLVGCEAEPTLE